MSELKVLIVGASIAGPTTAYWFAKTGANVTVIERFPELRTGGQGIDIRTVGVTVMRKIPGMEASVRAKTTQLEGISIVRDDGRPYGIMRASGDPNQQSLVSEYEIFRGDLSKILFDLTKDNHRIKYVFGEQIASMKQDNSDDGPVTVEFANGLLPTSDYDLVVACDGSTSRTRAMGLACGVRDHIKPTNCWAAYFSIERDLLQESKIGEAVTAIGGRFIAIGPDPAGVTRATLISIHPRDDRDVTLPFREAMKKGDTALKEFIAQRFKGAGWRTGEVMKDMMASEDLYANEVVQVKTPSLYKGRCALVGDAGYAPGFTGTGTSLAIVGAYLLAGEVGKHKGNIVAGLAGYEERMRPIITDLQKVPPLIPAVIAPQTAWGIWLRNNIFALICRTIAFISWTGILNIANKFILGSAASTDKYGLPDYEWAA